MILESGPVAKGHPKYARAKSGDAGAARALVAELVAAEGIYAVKSLLVGSLGESALSGLVSVHVHEREDVNAIPGALADILAARLGLSPETGIVQTTIVAHTGASGYGRLARQALFGGEVQSGRRYILVDDFVGQGGNPANLRGWIHYAGGNAIGGVVLAGKAYAATLRPSAEQLDAVRGRHGRAFE